MEPIATGYLLAEAPVARPDGGLYFSDAIAGGVYVWSPETGEVNEALPKRRGVGGMALHADGGLVVSGRDLSHVVDGEASTLFADESAAGFNDLTVDPDGRVVAGVLRFHPFRGEQPVPGEFVRVGRDGSAEVAIGGVEWANGCAFAPDGRTLYVCDFHRGVVLAAEVRDDDGFGPPRVVVEVPGSQPDGMAVDEDGCLWVALGGQASVGRFSPDGLLDRELKVPATFVSSVCFGGADGRDLFITTAGELSAEGGLSAADSAGAVFVDRSDVPGAPVPFVR